MQYVLKTPLSKQDLAPLKAGDTVLLSGVVYTARDAAHARMMELLDKGEPLPFPIEGAAIYYVGPTPERPGCAIGAAGPTTSGRMDAYTPRLLDLGLACMIGKGKRTDAVKQSVVKNGAVYLAAALFIVTMSGLGVAIANRSDTMQQTMFVMFFFVMIFVLMSGLITPIASMPGWAQAITRLLPPRYFIGIMRAVYLKGTALGELWGDYAALAGFALVFGMSAILTCRKRT